MKSTVALIAIIVGLITLTGCRDKDAAPAGTDQKPVAIGTAKPNTAPPASTASDRRPHENESDLLPAMK